MVDVHDAIKKLGLPFTFFDERDLPKSELELRDVADGIDGTLHLGPISVNLGEVSAVYLRLYGMDQSPGLRDIPRDSPSYALAKDIVDALIGWMEVAPILVVNRLSAMESNGSKPYQMRFIREQGFAVPETVVTTDPDVARRFWEEHGTVVYKSISGVRSIVAKLTPQHEQRLARVKWCPTQFQEYVPGKDYRVHIVGHDIFACEISSAADDYRYAHRSGKPVEIRPYQLPANIADLCRAITFSSGLEVAGIDLRRHPNGTWYCFEVNPSPAFSYYQNATGQPIDMAIAQLLRSGRSVARM
jgi:hypothetical protein